MKLKSLIAFCLIAASMALLPPRVALSQAGEKTSVSAQITIKDVSTGKETRFVESITVPSHAFDPNALTEKRFQALDREQTCREICKEQCYGTNPESGDWACYWTCRTHCTPATGGDPRKKIKSLTISIEVE